MDDALFDISERIWRDLHCAATTEDQSHPLRELVLASADAACVPHARLLILRDVRTEIRLLRFHTDVRSKKWRHVSEMPNVEILGYDRVSRVQIRLSGQAKTWPPGTPEHGAVWDSLPDWTRTTYCGGPPGHAVESPVASEPSQTPPARAETEKGRSRFGLLDVTVKTIDWYRHPRGDVRRAMLEYDRAHQLTSACWVAA